MGKGNPAPPWHFCVCVRHTSSHLCRHGPIRCKQLPTPRNLLSLDPQIVWLHVISDGLITLAYYCIPILLIYFTRKRLNLPFNRILWMFGTFILACGTTHLMEIWNIWHGDYLVAGVIKAITAAARDLIDIQTGARAYSLTGYDPFLEPSLAAQSAIRKDTEGTTRFAQAIASSRQQTHAPPSIAALEKNRQEVEAARATIREMVSEENLLLEQRTETARAGRNATRWTTFSGTLLGLITLAVAGFAIDREIRISAQARTEIGNLNASLEERVSQRTADLNAEIKERKEAEDHSAQLAAIVESSADAIFSKDSSGMVLSWNAGAEKLFGYTEEEAVGQPLRITLPGRERHTEEADREVLQGRRVVREEAQAVRKDGSLIDLSAIMSPLRDDSGTIVGASIIARDISERKRADETRDRLAAIVESSDDAIVSKTLEGIITAWNHGAKGSSATRRPKRSANPCGCCFRPGGRRKKPTFWAKSRAARASSTLKPRAFAKMERKSWYPIRFRQFGTATAPS